MLIRHMGICDNRCQLAQVTIIDPLSPIHSEQINTKHPPFIAVMVFRAAVLCTILSLASAGIVSKLHIDISSGDNNDLRGALSPSVQWTTGGRVGGTDYEVRPLSEWKACPSFGLLILNLCQTFLGRCQPRCKWWFGRVRLALLDLGKTSARRW